MPRELSAKDKAHIEQLNRFRKQYNEQLAAARARNIELDQKNKELAARNAELEKIIAQYEAHFGMSMEEFAAHCEREKKATEAVKTLMSLPNVLGIGGIY